jgi:hypothetical protein
MGEYTLYLEMYLVRPYVVLCGLHILLFESLKDEHLNVFILAARCFNVALEQRILDAALDGGIPPLIYKIDIISHSDCIGWGWFRRNLLLFSFPLFFTVAQAFLRALVLLLLCGILFLFELLDDVARLYDLLLGLMIGKACDLDRDALVPCFAFVLA